ncbi:MAG TPA: tetratricopeptide repeat protein [Terriglobales bacterium]|nr:tetratricopeptide repeat protein [Terriglobales bacterium]
MGDESANWWRSFTNSLPPKQILIPLALVLAVVLVYSPVSEHGFLRWDDNNYITDNPHVTVGLSAANIAWAFKETGIFYWHPLTWMSHMTDVQLFGARAGSHHAVNLILHAINVLLLFFLLYKGTGAFWRSSMVAALFAFHPLNVETVAWLSERKSLLSALFSFLTIAAYGWYVAKPAAKRYALVALAFLAALMSKPMAVTLPVLLLLIDVWPLRRRGQENPPSWGRLVLEKVPLLLMSVGSTVITIIGQRAVGAFATTGTIPLGMRIEQAFVSYVVYLRKLILPTDLAAFYPYHPKWIPILQLAGAILLLVAITAAAIRGRKTGYLIVGWLFFVLALGPVTGILQAGYVVIADRFAYIPAIGIFVAAVWGCAALVEKAHVPRMIPAVAGCVLVAVFAFASYHYVQYWRNGVVLFTRAAQVEKTPEPMIENLLADALLVSNRMDEAFEHYKRSCELNEKQDLCHFNMAEILFVRYDVQGALQHYLLAGTYTKDANIALHCLLGSGEAMLRLGDVAGAQRQYGYALSIDPSNETARRALMQIRAMAGQ